MANIPGEHIDHFFKRSIEQTPIAYDPLAWQQMEKILNRHAETIAAINRFFYASLAIAFLSMSLVFLIFFTRSVPAGNSDSANSLSNKPESFHKNAVSALNQNVGPEKKVSREESTLQKINSEKESGLTLAGKRTGKNFNPDTKRIFQPSTRKKRSLTGLPPAERKAFSFLPLSSELTKVDLNSRISGYPKQLPGTKGNIGTQRLIQKSPLLSIELLFSPDLSSVSLFEYSRMGTNFGFVLEYFITNNFSVTAGYIQSMKFYSASDEYEPYPGFWKNRTMPERIDADCKITDLPINFRYSFFDNKDIKLFVSSGLSTYLMNKENYEYIYAVEDPDLYKNYYVENKNQHLFRVINLSAGLEKGLWGNWSLQVEPFLKLPVSKIGVGKIKLMSTGAFLSIKYNFKKKSAMPDIVN